jgi:hypothetical protein
MIKSLPLRGIPTSIFFIKEEGDFRRRAKGRRAGLVFAFPRPRVSLVMHDSPSPSSDNPSSPHRGIFDGGIFSVKHLPYPRLSKEVDKKGVADFFTNPLNLGNDLTGSQIETGTFLNNSNTERTPSLPRRLHPDARKRLDLHINMCN